VWRLCRALHNRHTYAIRYLENGGDLYSLSQILGDTQKTVEDYYLDFSDKMQNKARGLVDYDFGLKVAK